MASSSNNLFLFSSLSLVCFFLFFFSENKSFVSATRSEEDSELKLTHHRVSLSSLIPSSSCSFPPQGGNKNNGVSLEVVHKHGPCSKLNKQPSSSTSSSSLIIPLREMLKEDEARVMAIQSKLSKTQNHHQQQQEEVETPKEGPGGGTLLPAKSGMPIGAGNYYVTVGLGSPKNDLSLTFDTGSDLTWTQCKPCVRSCYSQKEPIFDPSLSSSYSNISCSSSPCSQLVSATGFKPICSKATRACTYGALYGDGSFSSGYFAKEKLTISPIDVFHNFLFGCGHNNQGLFRGTAGLLGLGRHNLSFVQQTAPKYNKLFSYCLPSNPDTLGYIAFGAAATRKAKFTPFSSISRGSPFYGVDITGIIVGRVRLPISASVFASGVIIDSGTAITRLPPAAYSPLRDEFRKKMARYPRVDPVSILDTCYNLKGYDEVYVPTIVLSFGGGVNVRLDVNGVLAVESEEQVCLAFAANENDRDVAVIGNTQQKTIEVVYDVRGEKIGFRTRACE